MATSTGQDGKAASTSDADLLLHPELLSKEFLQLILTEKRMNTRDSGGRDKLTELYVKHVMPLPQRTLPSSRWGRRVEKSRGRAAPAGHSNDHNRKRPLIVFDGSSSNTGPLKVKKPEGSTVSAGATERLKPPPSSNLSNPIRRLSGNTSSSSSSSSIQLTARSTDTANLKREANDTGPLKSPDLKKKIQHVTWP
ncbi:ashwin [Sphaeramia orbicularis]|uniref:ashwin n=1 Tax=Sphaeramia orbicularis TaxID=375764 RepID=UPI00117DC886|nr:ashwin [Sphaeramia orbicularis]